MIDFFETRIVFGELDHLREEAKEIVDKHELTCELVHLCRTSDYEDVQLLC